MLPIEAEAAINSNIYLALQFDENFNRFKIVMFAQKLLGKIYLGDFSFAQIILGIRFLEKKIFFYFSFISFGKRLLGNFSFGQTIFLEIHF